MPAPEVVDEVVNVRSQPRAGTASRPMHEESVNASSGSTKIDRTDVVDENHTGSVRTGRTFSKSVEDKLAKMDEEDADARKPAPHEEGDADEGEEVGDAGEDEAAADADEPAGEEDAGEEGDGEEAGEEASDPSVEWQEKYGTLEARNRELIGELETARKTPRSQRTERETALVAAEASYIDEGSIPALRKFLGVIIGAAPDSKEVDAELAGVYTDLTARELGVPLDENQKALRDNARTRLLLARDRREKADAAKKTETDNSVVEVNFENAAKHAENLLATKVQGGTSLADEYPLLMTLAHDFDGYRPTEVLARAIKQEIETGTLNPNTSDIDMVRIVASKIEKHYDGVAKRIEAARAKTKKPGTTTPSVKPKAAVEPSTEQRQSTGARTLTNAAASRAPAKPPKANPPKIKSKSTVEKTRKDFKNEREWQEHLFDKHKM